jgi:hypothetical protein
MRIALVMRGVLKESFTMVFQMFLCGKSYENVHT